MSLDDLRPVRRIQRAPDAAERSGWPYALPPVAQLLRDGLDLPPGVTFLVGENGSGKSTLVEAVAVAAGLNAEGGSRHARYETRPSESDLAQVLQLVRSPGATWSYFLRAETMHGLSTYLERDAADPGPALHEMSHGESFLHVLDSRFADRGFYLLDEPESALSFTGCLRLVGLLHDVAARGGQVVCATHSPLLCSLPGSTVLELDEDGFHESGWAELELVQHWRRYLEDPQRYLRHLLG